LLRLLALLTSLVPALGSVLIALTLTWVLRIALLALILVLIFQGTKLGSKLRNLALLLIDLGAKLIMELLQLASHLRGMAVPTATALRALSAATTTHPGVTARERS